jgi:hypothetical protein
MYAYTRINYSIRDAFKKDLHGNNQSQQINKRELDRNFLAAIEIEPDWAS